MLTRLIIVKFADSKLNYGTSVSTSSTEKDLIEYFVGELFDMSDDLERENMQKCIAIELK
jgi:hypothetical protein